VRLDVNCDFMAIRAQGGEKGGVVKTQPILRKWSPIEIMNVCQGNQGETEANI
jgi:hypothetical protein